uniref:Uncharacterized protein n=1 Tax=Rhizophora mucronata TaxID=61149 RepID=A0A2P2Q0S1_RHIMU
MRGSLSLNVASTLNSNCHKLSYLDYLLTVTWNSEALFSILSF